MEDMRKRPVADVTADDASSSSSSASVAKRRRDQGGDDTSSRSVPPVGVVQVSVPPAVNEVVAESGDISVLPAVNDGDVSVSSPAAAADVFIDFSDMSCNSTTAPARLSFSENPTRSPKLFQTMTSSYVTINGNEESCGSSFSDAESSVMASVDRNGRDMEKARLDLEWYEAERWAYGHGESGFDDSAWDAAEDWSAREGMVLNLSLDYDWDDAALARFVGEDLN